MTVGKRSPSSHFVSRALPATPTAAAASDARSELPRLACPVRARFVTPLKQNVKGGTRGSGGVTCPTSGHTSKEKMIPCICGIRNRTSEVVLEPLKSSCISFHH